MFHLQRLKANVISDGTVLHVVLLVGMHIKEVDGLVSLDRALQEKDEKSTRTAHLQVIGKQASDGFVNQGLGEDVAGKAGLQGVSTQLHAKLDSIFTHLVEGRGEKDALYNPNIYTPYFSDIWHLF